MVHFTHPPQVPPGKGFVASSRPSSSAQELDLLGFGAGKQSRSLEMLGEVS